MLSLGADTGRLEMDVDTRIAFFMNKTYRSQSRGG